MRRVIIAAGLAFMASGMATAADNGIYVGVGLGQATLKDKEEFLSEDLQTVQLDFDQDDLGYKLMIGARPLDWFGLEAEYVNFGEQEQDVTYPVSGQPGTTFATTVTLEGYGIAGFLVGYVPIGPVDLFAKAGLVSWDTKGKIEDVSDWLRDDGEDMAYGLGVQFRLLSLGFRAEYELYDIDGVDDANLLSVGVTYTFL